MSDIFIDLDAKATFARLSERTLLEMIALGDFTWPDGASCATQASDGEITFWSAPASVVTEALSVADIETGKDLMPLIGFAGHISTEYFNEPETPDIDLAAIDWQESVVTYEVYSEYMLRPSK